MKKLIPLIFVLSITFGFGQNSISGQLFDLKKNQNIKLKKVSEMPRIWLSGNDITKGFYVSENGQFIISYSDIEELGNNISFSISSFNGNEKDNDYADFEIRNIPKKELSRVLKEVYLLKAYWIANCGNDCFNINVKRTFKEKVMWINASSITYLIRRSPEAIEGIKWNVKYVTDFTKDIIE